jgi:sugar (pentulose or hexulose) kinase
MLTGENTVGIGEASGVFPIDSVTLNYDLKMIEKLKKIIEEKGMPWKVTDVLPKVSVAGDNAGTLTKHGAELIDNLLAVGTKFAPPEGDAGTGMVATNAVASGTGNISAGTSIFSMVVLDKLLESVYEEIDMVTTPSGKPVAMVHCNNCTNDSNAWVSVLKEAINLFDTSASSGDIYTKLYEKSLEGDADCGGVLVCNNMAGEGITHLDEGRPFVIRRADSQFTLANFFRSTLYSTIVTLKIGMRILEKEKVEIKSLTGHGGLFKTPFVGQKYMAAACKAPVTVMKTAGEGGAYGITLLAAYAAEHNDNDTLEAYLNDRVFKNVDAVTVQPDVEDMNGFNKYTENYIRLLEVEKSAVENI